MSLPPSSCMPLRITATNGIFDRPSSSSTAAWACLVSSFFPNCLENTNRATGLGLLGYVENVGARYFGVFLATTAANANVPCVLTWQANNIRGQWKRALCSATLVGFGGVGGIIGGTVFRSQDKPTYRPGIWTAMIACAGIIVITLLMVWKFDRANKRVRAGGKPIEGLPGFLYTL